MLAKEIDKSPDARTYRKRRLSTVWSRIQDPVT